MSEKFPTVRDILLKYLDAMPENQGRRMGRPRTYMGLPVDLSNLDTPINGYVVQRFRPLKKTSS
jgi:hypothetical protein